jgi:hypothetical protein
MAKNARIPGQGDSHSRATKANPLWPAYTVERWPIERLTPYAKNARTHSDAQIEQLRKAIRAYGWTVPILAREDGTVIAGHGRLLAAGGRGGPGHRRTRLEKSTVTSFSLRAACGGRPATPAAARSARTFGLYLKLTEERASGAPGFSPFFQATDMVAQEIHTVLGPQDDNVRTLDSRHKPRRNRP